MTARSGYDFRGRQIPPSTRADWRHDARPTNYDGGRTAILARRIVHLLDALEAAEADLAQAWADGYNHAKVEMLTLGRQGAEGGCDCPDCRAGDDKWCCRKCHDIARGDA